jgi:hypothetical protein
MLNKVTAHGNTGGAITRMDVVGQEAFCNFKYEPDTLSDWFDKHEAQTEFAVKLQVIGPTIAGSVASTEYTITVIFAKCRVRMPIGEPTEDNGKLVRNVELEIMANVVGADDQSEFCMVDLTDTVQFYAAT